LLRSSRLLDVPWTFLPLRWPSGVIYPDRLPK
jgi:hypothetical protein